MKFEKWTLGLVAVGVVSLASVVRADETGGTGNAVQTALSATTLSGYVDTSAQWNFGTGNGYPPPVKFNQGKQDGFNLDVVQLSIAKPLDETEWAAGYRADLWMGPDASLLGTQSSSSSSDFAIRQAYVAFRTPVGSGLDWKLGVFDSIIGYESVAAPNNPNYTRSYGHTIEPQTHTGLLASYRAAENFSFTAGIADTVNPAINARAQDGSSGVVSSGPFESLWNAIYSSAAAAGGVTTVTPVAGGNAHAESYKAYMASMALTASDNMGFLSGSTLYAGVVGGYNNSVLGSGLGNSQWNGYLGATIATPATGLRLGISFDYLDSDGNGTLVDDTATTQSFAMEIDAYATALYLSYQATEKMSLHGRLEYYQQDLSVSSTSLGYSAQPDYKFWALTGTIQYDLWKNVLSRLEFRWDHSEHGTPFGGTTLVIDPFTGDVTGGPDRANAFMLAANVIYKF